MSARIAFSAARSAAGTGAKPPVFLFSIASAVRKKGRMVSPEAVASWSTKLVKSTAVIHTPNRSAGVPVPTVVHNAGFAELKNNKQQTHHKTKTKRPQNPPFR